MNFNNLLFIKVTLFLNRESILSLFVFLFSFLYCLNRNSDYYLFSKKIIIILENYCFTECTIFFYTRWINNLFLISRSCVKIYRNFYSLCFSWVIFLSVRTSTLSVSFIFTGHSNTSWVFINHLYLILLTIKFNRMVNFEEVLYYWSDFYGSWPFLHPFTLEKV